MGRSAVACSSLDRHTAFLRSAIGHALPGFGVPGYPHRDLLGSEDCRPAPDHELPASGSGCLFHIVLLCPGSSKFPVGRPMVSVHRALRRVPLLLGGRPDATVARGWGLRYQPVIRNPGRPWANAVVGRGQPGPAGYMLIPDLLNPEASGDHVSAYPAGPARIAPTDRGIHQHFGITHGSTGFRIIGQSREQQTPLRCRRGGDAEVELELSSVLQILRLRTASRRYRRRQTRTGRPTPSVRRRRPARPQW